MPDDHLKHLCEKISNRIQSQWPVYEGHAVRADAGDPGMIYVALRDAKREHDLGEKLSAEIGSLIERELSEEPKGDALDFAISVGSGHKDLLLQIELRYV